MSFVVFLGSQPRSRLPRSAWLLEFVPKYSRKGICMHPDWKLKEKKRKKAVQTHLFEFFFGKGRRDSRLCFSLVVEQHGDMLCEVTDLVFVRRDKVESFASMGEIRTIVALQLVEQFDIKIGHLERMIKCDDGKEGSTYVRRC
jgi:hypothetical protein